MVECEASTFPLVNLTKVSTAAHSTQCLSYHCFMARKRHFGAFSFFNSKYLLALLKAGLISNPVPTSPASTAGGGDSPSYSGFFHCLAVFDDRSSPCLTQAAVYCARNPFPRVLHPV